MNQRIEVIDGLRGIASLSVCWFHMTSRHPEGSLVRNSGLYGWLGVEIFFVISGFIIPFALYRGKYKLTHHWGTFILKRIIRIDPPYLVAAVFAASLWYLSAMMPGFRGQPPNYSLPQLLLHFGYLNGIFGYPWIIPAFWTLAIEFQYYLLISLTLPVLTSEKALYRYVGLALLCAAAFIFPSSVLVFKYLCLFTLGIIGFLYFVQIISRTEFLVLELAAAILLYLSLGGLITTVGIITILIINFIPFKKVKLFSFLGAISYSLYVIHTPTGGRVINYGTRFVDNELQYFFLSVFAVLVSIGFAYALYFFVERPAQKWSSKIKYKDNT